MGSETEEEEKRKKAKMSTVELFNYSPKDAIERIDKGELVGKYKKEKQIAKFFHDEKNNLDLDAVGDYLGTGGTQNKEVLNEFASTMNFKGKDFVTSLREFSKEFNLPGESQKIERVVEAFAEEFCKQNPEVGYKADDAFLLAYSIMQLNSDLHNPAVKDKMTQEQYISQLNGRPDTDGKRKNPIFPDETLKAIHEDIKTNEFKFNVTKIAPGYEIQAETLENDKTFQKLDLLLKSSKSDNKKLSKVFSGIGEDVTCTYKPQKKPFLKSLTGHEGTMILEDKKNGGIVHVQVYKPNAISKFFYKDKPKTMIIKPVLEKGISAQRKSAEASLKLAATIAANFSSPCTVKSTYDFEKADMEKAYAENKAKVGAVKIGNVVRDKQATKQNKEESATPPIPTRARSTPVIGQSGIPKAPGIRPRSSRSVSI